MSGYVYRRTENIDREPTAPYVFREAERGPRKRPRRKDYNPALCGSTKGYWQHRRYDEDQCPGCAAAYSDYLRGYRERKGGMNAEGHAPVLHADERVPAAPQNQDAQ